MTLQPRPASKFAALALACCATTALAQTGTPDARPADPKPAQTAPSEPGRGPEIVQTFYLKYATQRSDLNDVSTAIRNVENRARIFTVMAQNAIAIRGTTEEVHSAQTLIAALDLPRKSYRLTYTITDLDNGKRIGIQHFTLVATAGEKVVFKQGSRVPIATGSYGPLPSSSTNTQFQYLDVGLEIEASVATITDGISLNTKVSQSSLAEEKSAASLQDDPIIRQTSFEGTAILVTGKPLNLGSLDTPGSTRHQEIEVVSDLIH